MKPDSKICIICKGSRLLCRLKSCPLLKKYYIQKEVKAEMEKITSKASLFGPSPPNLFVGSFGYPGVRCGPLLSISEEVGIGDDPAKWYGLPIEEIIKFRSYLLRPMQVVNVKERTRAVENIQEAILSVKPIDIETKISGKPHLTITFSSYFQPMGPYAKMEWLKICENPKIPNIVDEVLSEKMKAAESTQYLYEKGFDVYYLTKALSAGLLGIKKKIVPTRWSITALDSILAKNLIDKIKDHPQITNYEVYSSEYLENHFEILLIPGSWEFENFESWAPGTLWTTSLTKPEVIEDYEGWEGRKTYSIQSGGYYASRFAITEFLEKRKKQAKVVVFREIFEGYQCPVGVWQIRENIRHALSKPQKKFDNMKEALTDISTRLRVPVSDYVRESKIISQSRVTEY